MPPQLLTPGLIASELGYPIHRVLYVIKSRKIQPTARAGILRLFGRDAAVQISEALKEIESDRQAASKNKA